MVRNPYGEIDAVQLHNQIGIVVQGRVWIIRLSRVPPKDTIEVDAQGS